MTRAYYRQSISQFLNTDNNQILGELLAQHTHQKLDDLQRNAWQKQIAILKNQLQGIDGHIYFEFSIPRMGKRVDNIVIIGDTIFLLEFKIGEIQYRSHDLDQVIDYALDMRNFHEGSHQAKLIPILLAEKAPNTHPQNNIQQAINFQAAIRLNAANLGSFLRQFSSQNSFDIAHWEQSAYKPTPTIVEAAQTLYQKHDVREITRSDAGAQNLSLTANCISQIIDNSKKNHQKTICFITGVPGAGKTLAGLNIANQRLQTADDEHAVFLSGNGPLVAVLQEALARNSKAVSKKEATSHAKTFIQNIHHFRDEYLQDTAPPTEKVVIFDEAQRAWNEAQTSAFMKRKRGREDFCQSEPDFLIEVMNRHQDWCVIIALIGGGQEINTGEAGLSEWVHALKTHYADWQVHYSPLIVDEAHYLDAPELCAFVEKQGIIEPHLHLATSVRSFRSAKVSAFIHAVLDNNLSLAKTLYQEIKDNYPIVLTRDLNTAKMWLHKQARGSERFGLIASSGARRLKALGVNVKNEIEVEKWFLNDKNDVRSSYFLEDVASEFDVQGLELDFACVAWDGNFYYDKGWHYQNFKGTKWQNVRQAEEQKFIQNAHRVLLTRARQGMVIWVPEGNENDHTRPSRFYDGTYEFWRGIGVRVL
ncbi:DUF2075 domain-containing protein [Wielerella bovis]|uniref:DUF2075 domain-containing protein n=1 Tax=Wielerella bovis TaxID=2917790 RepID=UPI00201985A1|nr:DUF2075 domain-containing protein [Wielerella bovis]ULJ68725.1 DUF2075 domain-containing protein [Wielerella bovis]